MNASADPHHEEREQVFVLTCDLGEKVESFRRIGITTPDPNDAIFKEIQQELALRVQEALPSNVSVRSISMKNLSDDILQTAYRAGKIHDDFMVVSTCSEIADPMRGVTLEINRLVDFEGRSIGIGPRPGHKDIDDQILEIRFRANGRKLVLVEDGAFSGSTLRFVVERFMRHGLNISVIAVGFMFPAAALSVEAFRGYGIEFYSVEEFENLLDWVPDHDFIPFVPNCGKVIGLQHANAAIPFYNFDHASYSIPYLRPFGPMTDWASIPESKTAALSKACLEQAYNLFRHLDSLNSERILIRDLLHGNQRSSVPIAVGQTRLPRSDVTVTEYLNDTLHAF